LPFYLPLQGHNPGIKINEIKHIGTMSSGSSKCDKEEHLLFGEIETETSGQLTSDILTHTKREIEADWVRVEALCISCQPRTRETL
jgi:hypothetical protein